MPKHYQSRCPNCHRPRPAFEVGSWGAALLAAAQGCCHLDPEVCKRVPFNKRVRINGKMVNVKRQHLEL